MSDITFSPLPSAHIASSQSGLAHKVGDAPQNFESVLLGQWLQQAEDSFGSVPGEEDEDSGDSQMKEFAMQHLAQEITKSGGIGIAKMVERALIKSAGLGGTAADLTAESGKSVRVAALSSSQLSQRSVSGGGKGE